jgi:hypothetical protein
MKNWEACHECEDDDDAERLRKRAALTAESIAMTTSINQTLMNFESENHDLDMLEISSDSLAKNCARKVLSRHVPATANPKVCLLTSTVFGRLCSSAFRRAMQW